MPVSRESSSNVQALLSNCQPVCSENGAIQIKIIKSINGNSLCLAFREEALVNSMNSSGSYGNIRRISGKIKNKVSRIVDYEKSFNKLNINRKP